MKFVKRLAKFEDYNAFSDNGFSSDSIPANTAFSDSGTITVGSKMNKDVEGEPPF
jgi:hypothetical protein